MVGAIGGFKYGVLIRLATLFGGDWITEGEYKGWFDIACNWVYR